jgi:aminoacrylate hydrolase
VGSEPDPAYKLASFRKIHAGMIRSHPTVSNDRRKEFHRITVPTLVIGADDDILAPRYFSEEFVRLIPGARAHFATCGGHALTKTQADLFNRIALEFFTEVTA